MEKQEEGAWTEQMDAAVNYVELLICCLFSPSLRFCVELFPHQDLVLKFVVNLHSVHVIKKNI